MVTAEMTDCGAIRCPVWFAEAIMVLIELEARDQGLKAGVDANENARCWLEKYGYSKQLKEKTA